MSGTSKFSSIRASRRGFLGGSIAAGATGAFGIAGMGSAEAKAAAALGIAPPRQANQKTMAGVALEPLGGTVRVGVMGVGNRGGGQLPSIAAIPGVQITAINDHRPDKVRSASNRLAAEGYRRPREYSRGENDFERMAEADDIDFVYIASNWEMHFPMAKASLLGGKHVGIEQPIATELDELWELVDLSEQTRKHVQIMENCNYGRQELAILKMSQAGVFGELTHAHGGYMHDLRSLLFDPNYYDNEWRRKWYTRTNRAFYMMHGLGPMSAALGINRGDRLTTMQVTSSAANALYAYREQHVSKDRTDVWQEEYLAGDRVTAMIKTERGRMIRAEHNTSEPRPYSRINAVSGANGIFEGYPDGRIYVESDGHTDHQWRDPASYLEEHDHWLWQDVGDDAEHHGGHGGMDYLMFYRVMQILRQGLVPDVDVYDSAAWCSTVPLSETALETESIVEIPDFTRGNWEEDRPGLNSERAPLLD